MVHSVNRITVSLPPALVTEVRARGDNFSGALQRALTRYLETLRHERAALREMLSEDELSLILDALDDVGMRDQRSPAFILYEVANAIRLDHLDSKWGVDGPALMEKLSRLSYAQLCALADAVERFLWRVGRGEHPPASSALE